MTIRPDKETGAAIRAAAAEAGQSNQQYILQATRERMTGGDPYGLDQGQLRQHITETGETVPQFVNRAVDETMQRDRFTSAIRKEQEKIHG